MYNSRFKIEKAVSNNSFSSEKRKWRSLFVPNLVEWILENIQVWENIVFEECNEKWEIISFIWLKNFIKTKIYWIPTYIFDNHNHAFYFWNEAIVEWIIWEWSTLIHIDEHSDLAIPDEEYRMRNEQWEIDLEKVFEYTNNVLNVWNYIVPAVNLWIISKVIKVTGEIELNKILSEISKEKWDLILNFDVDFFSTWMDYINYEKKKRIIRKVAKRTKLITIATSPFFIDQNKAIEVIKDLFWD